MSAMTSRPVKDSSKVPVIGTAGTSSGYFACMEEIKTIDGRRARLRAFPVEGKPTRLRYLRRMIKRGCCEMVENPAWAASEFECANFRNLATGGLHHVVWKNGVVVGSWKLTPPILDGHSPA